MENVIAIFLCNCKIKRLEKSGIDFHTNTYIAERYHEERERAVFAAYCKDCLYNVSSGLERNYFSTTNLLLC